MPFAPAAEFPGLIHHNLKVNPATTLPANWYADQDFHSRFSPTPKSLYYNCWFRMGIDPMRAAGSAFVHCKFGDEHLPLLDPMKPDTGFYERLRTTPALNSALDGSQWCSMGKFQWCEYSGCIIDGSKGGHGIDIEDSYIHDLMRTQTDFYVRLGQTTDVLTHNDGIQIISGGTEGPSYYRRNRIVMRQDHMSAFMIGPDTGNIDAVVIEDNYLAARNTIFAISKKGASYRLGSVTVRNNVFSRACIWPLVNKYLDTAVTKVIWEGNTWDDAKRTPLSFADACKNPAPRPA